MKNSIILFCILIGQSVRSQTDVFECSTYQETVTQEEIDAVSTYFGNCILFNEYNNYDFTSNQSREVLASNQIHIKPGFHTGGYTDNSSMHLAITPKSSLEVAVMNYDDLQSINKYKKFELGVKLPNEVLEKVNNYLFNQGMFPEDELNPFMEWDIDLEAVFLSTENDWYEVIDGFYFRDYQQNENTNDWDDVSTDFPMRIRYAPPRNGKWICYINLKINGVTEYSSSIFSFNVVESGDPGYVYVHPNKRNLMRGDDMIFPVGQNFPGPEDAGLTYGIGNDLFSFTQTTKAARPESWNRYLSKIENYFQMGGKYIRTIQFPSSSLIEFEKKGNYYDRLHYAWEQDKLLDLCENYDGLVQFNLLLQDVFMEYANYDNFMWDWNRWIFDESSCAYEYNTDFFPGVYCYNDNPQPSGGKQAHEMFTNESDLQYHEQRTRYYIARYGYSTNIYEFELLSEPFHLDQKWQTNKCPTPGNYVSEPYLRDGTPEQQIVINAVETYQNRMASYIKNHLHHWQQLVGVNATLPSFKPDGISIMDQSFRNENVDIAGINWYNTSPNKYIFDSHDNPKDNNTFLHNENTFAKAVNYFQTYLNSDEIRIPVILNEGDHGDGSYDCSGNVGNKIDAMCMGFTGVCGFNFWQGKDGHNDIGVTHQDDIWPATIRAQYHMNGDDVINTLSQGYGNWVQGRQAENYNNDATDYPKFKEAQYYVSQNKELAVGYIRNLTYNLATTSENGGCDFNYNYPLNSLLNTNWYDGQNNLLLWVNGLKNNTDYQVDWYSYGEGYYLESDCQNTVGKKFKLKHPTLNTTFDERPIVWFVIKQNNCDNKMVISDELELKENYHIHDSTVINALELSINEENIEYKKIKVYPNPFADEIFIEINNPDELTIKSLSGIVVFTSSIPKGKQAIELSNLASGVYFISFKDQNSIFKIMKQ